MRSRFSTVSRVLVLAALTWPNVGVYAQGQSQIQYSYDAAGRLVGVTRTELVPKPDLVISDLVVGYAARQANGSYLIPVSFRVTNSGALASTPPWTDRGYLSTNALLDDLDLVLDGGVTRSTSLPINGTYTVSGSFSTNPATAPGAYTLFVKSDGGASPQTPTGPGAIAEVSEANNVLSAPLTLPTAVPDLIASGISVGTITATQAGAYQIPLSFTVINIGGAAANNFASSAYLSANDILDNGDTHMVGPYQSTPLNSGGSFVASATFGAPASVAAGTYSLFVKADGRGPGIAGTTIMDTGSVAESNEGNNTSSLVLTLPSKPDLGVSAATITSISTNIAGAYVIGVSFVVTNAGQVAAAPGWYDGVYLSADATLDNADLVLASWPYRSTALGGGASYTVSQTFSTPTSTQGGTYTAFFKADARGSGYWGTNTDTGALNEPNEANNLSSLALTLPTKQDLAISAAAVGALATNPSGGYVIPITYTITNVGGLPVPPNWFESAALSSNATLENSDTVLPGSTYIAQALQPGAGYTVTRSYSTAASVQPDTYTVFVKADGAGYGYASPIVGDGAVGEASESNNIVALPLTLPTKADLEISGVSVGTITKLGNNERTIPVTYTVTNVGGTYTGGNWYDMAYLSADATLDSADGALQNEMYRTTMLAPGASYTVTQTFKTYASAVAGAQTLFIKADGPRWGSGTGTGALLEASETNNVASISVVLP